MRDQADQYGARRVSGQIETLKGSPTGDFTASWEGGRVTAPTVLLATGGLDVEPEIPDVRRLVNEGLIRHCPICEAFETTGKRIALVAYGKCRINEALLLRGYTSDLTVLTLGHRTKLAEANIEILGDAGVKIVFDAVQRLTRENNQIGALTSSDAEPLLFDTIYSALGVNLRSELAVGLGAKLDEDGALIVDSHQQTNIRGLYAAGDIVHGLSQVSVAAGHAAIAATAINRGLPPVIYSALP